MITFTLPVPPSTNGLYFNRPGGRTVTGAYERWRETAAKLVMIQRMDQAWPIRGAYTLEATFEAGMKGDLDNRLKALSDLLQHMRIVENDALAQRIVLSRGEVEGCRVEIQAHQGA